MMSEVMSRVNSLSNISQREQVQQNKYYSLGQCEIDQIITKSFVTSISQNQYPIKPVVQTFESANSQEDRPIEIKPETKRSGTLTEHK